MRAFGHSHHHDDDEEPSSIVSKLYEMAESGQQPDSSLVSQFGSSIEKKGDRFGPEDIARALFAVAKMGLNLNPKILAALTGLIVLKSGSFKPAQIATVIWALGKLGTSVDPGVVGALARAVKDKASQFRPQEAANALWGLIQLDQRNGGRAIKTIAGLGAAGVAAKAFKGMVGGGQHDDKHDSKHKDKQSEADRITSALEELQKSGADPKTIKAMREAAKNASKDAGNGKGSGDDNEVADAIKALGKMGHAPEERHHSLLGSVAGAAAGVARKAVGF